ncbi:hypothetical protein Scep_016599 [Stephania cephalantha]|uniref:Uncharacterized protein n=1 Tax=Stephania cephalantha TaxID=152367 RepID=A0AAP0IN09_9MAGN
MEGACNTSESPQNPELVFLPTSRRSGHLGATSRHFYLGLSLVYKANSPAIFVANFKDHWTYAFIIA